MCLLKIPVKYILIYLLRTVSAVPALSFCRKAAFFFTKMNGERGVGGATAELTPTNGETMNVRLPPTSIDNI